MCSMVVPDFSDVSSDLFWIILELFQTCFQTCAELELFNMSLDLFQTWSRLFSTCVLVRPDLFWNCQDSEDGFSRHRERFLINRKNEYPIRFLSWPFSTGGEVFTI